MPYSRGVTSRPVTSNVCAHARRYPYILGKDDKAMIFERSLPSDTEYCCTWRGGGFDDECKQFYEEMFETKKFYRVPGFLATSQTKKVAMNFIGRADRESPRVLWCILVCIEAPGH